MADNSYKTATKLWVESLEHSGYEPPRLYFWKRIKLRFMGHAWLQILWHTGFLRSKQGSILEFGSGGGDKLMPLYLRGWQCIGVEVSPEVIKRATVYVENVKQKMRPSGKISFCCCDFLEYEDACEYDIVYQAGVLEHFLDDNERIRYLKKMFSLVKDGGWVVSLVPSGVHPARKRQREYGLGGYNIPEIDYTADKIISEMMRCGGVNVRVLPHQIFGYWFALNGRLRQQCYRLCSVLSRFLPGSCWQKPFAYRHAYWFIGLAMKPGKKKISL